ncbi:MAG: hypothetical protein E7168_02675 [Firmicutes bacterium]|nr:hypothetical protein [Bacillota bacterium]
MLKKLLKYDLKGIFKFLLIFYSLSLFFALLTRIFFSIENSFIMNIIGQICSGAAISMMFSILINNLMRMWVKFKHDLYGDESYLTHTLPVEKKTLYVSKVLTALITLFTSVVVIALTLYIAYYSKENLELLKNLLLPVADAYDSTIIKIVFAFLFIFFLEFANTLQVGFTGIILGHKMNNAKVGYSVLFGFGAYMVMQIFGLLIIFLISLFNSDLMNLFITNEMINVGMVKTVVYLGIIFYSITFIIGYFVNLKLFKKGVNVD